MPPKVSLFLPTDRVRASTHHSNIPRCQTPKHPVFSPSRSMKTSINRSSSQHRLSRPSSRSTSSDRNSSRELVRKPWESQAVSKFASRVGVDQRAQPMVIRNQGQTTILGALGDPDDHQIAGSVLQRIGSASVHGITRPKKQSSSTALAQTNDSDVAFGVVYEHRDCFGAPKFVGSTDMVAEKQFKLDYQSNSAVDQVVNRNQGSTDVVWAGYGTGPIGKQEMNEIRTTIEHHRAERLRIQKLSSVKPYSKHGF